MYKISSYWYHTTNAILLGLIGESSVFLSVFSYSIKTIFLFSLLKKPQYLVFTHYTSLLKLSLLFLFSLIRAISVLYCCHQFSHFFRKSRYITLELSHLTLFSRPLSETDDYRISCQFAHFHCLYHVIGI